MRATPALVVVALLVVAPSLAAATPDAPAGDDLLTNGSEVTVAAEGDETATCSRGRTDDLYSQAKHMTVVSV